MTRTHFCLHKSAAIKGRTLQKPITAVHGGGRGGSGRCVPGMHSPQRGEIQHLHARHMAHATCMCSHRPPLSPRSKRQRERKISGPRFKVLLTHSHTDTHNRTQPAPKYTSHMYHTHIHTITSMHRYTHLTHTPHTHTYTLTHTQSPTLVHTHISQHTQAHAHTDVSHTHTHLPLMHSQTRHNHLYIHTHLIPHRPTSTITPLSCTHSHTRSHIDTLVPSRIFYALGKQD